MGRSSRFSAVNLLLVLASIFLSACGGGGSESGVNGGENSTGPTPTPVLLPAPAAMQGTWTTTIKGSNQKVTLVLGATSYQITKAPDQAFGSISVTGERIDFSNSTACIGTGPYRWSITGSSLSFTPVTADACPGRSEVIAGYTYIKSP